MDAYEHQLEVHKRDGSTYKMYVVSHGPGYTYIIYKDGAHVTSGLDVQSTMDDAFQAGFTWIKQQ